MTNSSKVPVSQERISSTRSNLIGLESLQFLAGQSVFKDAQDISIEMNARKLPGCKLYYSGIIKTRRFLADDIEGINIELQDENGSYLYDVEVKDRGLFHFIVPDNKQSLKIHFKSAPRYEDNKQRQITNHLAEAGDPIAITEIESDNNKTDCKSSLLKTEPNVSLLFTIPLGETFVTLVPDNLKEESLDDNFAIALDEANYDMMCNRVSPRLFRIPCESIEWEGSGMLPVMAYLEIEAIATEDGLQISIGGFDDVVSISKVIFRWFDAGKSIVAEASPTNRFLLQATFELPCPRQVTSGDTLAIEMRFGPDGDVIGKCDGIKLM